MGADSSHTYTTVSKDKDEGYSSHPPALGRGQEVVVREWLLLHEMVLSCVPAPNAEGVCDKIPSTTSLFCA